MRSSYSVGSQALATWRARYGNASLDQQCIRFDGYYWQEAYQGNEAIRSYSTATAAADASPMYTSDVNDPNAEPGDLWYWWWNPEGHVGTVLGHDADGRVLVTHTSSSGDLVEQWGNNVRISHADTIPHRFRGGSHHYGSNTRRTGLEAWPIPKQAEEEIIELGEEDLSKPMLVMKLDNLENHTKGVMIEFDGTVTTLTPTQWGFWVNFADVKPIECTVSGQWEYIMGVMAKRRERLKGK